MSGRAEVLMGEWLGKVRAVMYAETLGERAYQETAVWFGDVQLLRQALTWAPKEAEARGWQVPAEVYTALVTRTLLKISGRARVPFREMRRRAAYFFHALQDEFRHNWDEYWDAAKRAGTVAEELRGELGRRGATGEAADDTQAVLARAHELIAGRGGRPKKGAKGGPARGEIQEELF